MSTTRRKAVVPGCSIWPQPKRNPRERYRITYATGRRLPSGRMERRTIYASSDLATTLDLAREVTGQRDRVRLGLSKAIAERYAAEDRKPIAEHLDDWRGNLAATGATPKHVRQFSVCATALLNGTRQLRAEHARKHSRGRTLPELEGVGALHVSQIVPSLVQREVAKVKTQRGAATANRYLDALHAFLNWGVADMRWERNPIAHLGKFSVEADRKRVRRTVSAEDIARLIRTADAGQPSEGVPGFERGLIYRTCVATGLRANELRHVRTGDLVVGPQPGIWTTAKRAKNRKRLLVKIPVALAELLAAYVAGREPAAPIFRVPANTARMLRRDLAACDPPIPYVNELGEVFDFHALRHECGAVLIAAGVSPKAVQTHLRHSSIKLTMDTYGHMMETDAAALRAAIPVVEPDQQARRLAQRNDAKSVRSRSLPFVSTSLETTPKAQEKAENGRWSHGESNPDLLNAIQPSKSHKGNEHNPLADHARSGAALGAALPGAYVRIGGMIRPRRRRRVRTPIGDSARRQVAEIVRGLGTPFPSRRAAIPRRRAAFRKQAR